MELISIGFLAGIVIALIVFMAVLYGRVDDVERICEGKFLLDSNSSVVHNNTTNLFVDNSKRDSSLDKISKNEMKLVIRYFRLGATSYEKQVLDSIEELIEG